MYTLKLSCQRLKNIFNCKSTTDVKPKSKNCKRRLLFFLNSLFMDMPATDSLIKCVPFSVMTPYYSEDVMYSKKKVWLLCTDQSMLFTVRGIVYKLLCYYYCCF